MKDYVSLSFAGDVSFANDYTPAQNYTREGIDGAFSADYTRIIKLLNDVSANAVIDEDGIVQGMGY